MTESRVVQVISRLMLLIGITLSIPILSKPALAQKTLDLETAVSAEWNGRDPHVEVLNADLYDGFNYRIPFSIRSHGNNNFVDIQARTDCKCAVLKIVKFTPASPKQNYETAEGEILIHATGADILQDVYAYGVLADGENPVKLARIGVHARVFPPVGLKPTFLEVARGAVSHKSLEVKSLKGVEILEAVLSDSQSLLETRFDADKKIFELTNALEVALPSSGELFAEFRIKYEGVEAKTWARVPYGPRSPFRVVPNSLSLQTGDDGTQLFGRLMILGLDRKETSKPSFVLDRLAANGKWVSLEGLIHIESFGEGKAMGKLTLDREQDKGEWTWPMQVRIRDESSHERVTEFRVVLDGKK